MLRFIRAIGRVITVGIAGGVSWRYAMRLIFGSAQKVLTNASWQSAKMLAAFTLPPVPRTSRQPELLWIGLFLIGILWAAVYRLLAVGWSPPWWRKGLLFWAVSWVIMVPWFEFYLPWNVMLEPFPLVTLELVCWAGVLLVVAVTISGVDHLFSLRSREPNHAMEPTANRPYA